MNARPTRIGVVGVGSLGFHHARILRDVSGVTMAGVYDRDSARAASVGAELGLPVFATLDEFLSRVDAAVIAVSTSSHAEVARRAITAGVHLLIEKPLAATLEEADDIVGGAAAAGVLVATGHVERFNGALRACEEFLEEPRFIESHRLATFNPRGTDVAVVLDLMIHDIDLVLGLVGGTVDRLDAAGVPVLTSSADIANARLVFDGGAVANITASRVSFERVRKIRLFQRSGYISLNLAAGTGEFLRLRGGAAAPEWSTAEPSLANVVERIVFQGDGTEPLRAELESFVRAVRGEGPLLVSGRDGREALRVALRIMDSIAEHAVAGLAG